jgi:hypothetical protein
VLTQLPVVDIKVDVVPVQTQQMELKLAAAVAAVTSAAAADDVKFLPAQFKTVAAVADLVTSIHLALACSKLSMAAMQLQDKDQLVEPRAAST